MSQKTTIVSDFINQANKDVDKYLDIHLPKKIGYADQLVNSMQYSLLAGGKRIRPALAIAAFQVCGGKGDKIYLATSALEMIHTFSLIHDDLPCMDDDDLRRGKPTNHKIYGDATAVLAGDALCILAFELLARTGNTQCIETLASALGIEGMLGGQIEDILAEGKEVDLETVNYIHSHKTAALIQASLIIGAQLADTDSETLGILSRYGEKIGMAFQIIDDILDIVQTTEVLGKDAGSDTSKQKATYPAVIGLEKSKETAFKLANEAIDTLESLKPDMGILIEIARFIINRVN